ncbi:MAG: hypothetical protein HXX09_09035 [Bacteroidetes bacterium]|nr:hypothetical protein [Bacteroidota bacterium]
MTFKQILYSGSPKSILTLSVPKSSRFTRIILIFFTIFFFIMPILSTIFIIYFEQELKFGFAIFYIVFWLAGFYFLRLFLWNSHGKEVLTFGKEKISYFTDYKFFKDRRISISNQLINIEIIEKEVNFEKKATLKIFNETETIETSIKVPFEDLKELVESIKLHTK